MKKFFFKSKKENKENATNEENSVRDKEDRINQLHELLRNEEESNADTIDIECKIDDLVYTLYNLIKEKIKLIEGVNNE